MHLAPQSLEANERHQLLEVNYLPSAQPGRKTSTDWPEPRRRQASDSPAAPRTRIDSERDSCSKRNISFDGATNLARPNIFRLKR